MKPNESIQIEFIKDLLRKGLDRKDILPKFTEIYHKSEKTFNTRLAIAKIAISDENKRNEDIRQELTEQSIREAVNEAIVSDEVLEGILCKIACGNMEVEEIIKGVPVLRSISPSEITGAVAQLFKKRGSYSATKTEVAITDGLKSITINPASLRKNDSDTTS